MVSPPVVFLIQTVIAGLVLVPTAFLILVSGGTYEGGPAVIGYVVGPPVMSFLTIGFVSLLGLPIRLIPALLTWWKAHSWIMLVTGVLGFIAVMVSFNPELVTIREIDVDGVTQESVEGVWWLTALGWFVLAFSLVHLWNPFPAGPDQQPELPG